MVVQNVCWLVKCPTADCRLKGQHVGGKKKIKCFNPTKTKNEHLFTLKRVEIYYITTARVMVSTVCVTVWDFFPGLFFLSLYSCVSLYSYLFKNDAFKTLA